MNHVNISLLYNQFIIHLIIINYITNKLYYIINIYVIRSVYHLVNCVIPLVASAGWEWSTVA